MIRQIVTLLSGNVLSQLVNVATILFVVTAFFLPAEFGRYAVLMSYVGILSSVACLRYELAIISVAGKLAANNLFMSSTVIATLFCVLVYVVFELLTLLAGNGFLFGTSSWMIALLIYLKAIDQICASVLYRHESYFRYAMLKLLQAIVLFLGIWIAGSAGKGLNGLLISTLLAYAAFAMAGLIAIRHYGLRSGLRKQRMLALLKRHGDFVRFNAPQALIDNFLANGLNFVLVGLAGPTVTGYFNYMQRILKAPLGLVFGAVSQVVFRFSAKNRGDPERVVHKLKHVLGIVAGILSSAAVGVAIIYTFFFKLDFLTDWAGLREYMVAFAVWMLVPFLFSPFATLPIVYGRQKQFFLMAATFNLSSLAVLALLIWQASVNTAFLSVGLMSVLYFTWLGVWIFRVMGSGQKS